jgi:hypothetical protein
MQMASHRVQRERSQFRMAVLPETVENPRYWLLGLIPAIVLSALLIGFRLTLHPLIVLALGTFSTALAFMPAFMPVLLGTTGLIIALVPAKIWLSLNLPQMPLGSWSTNFAILVGCLAILGALVDKLLPVHNSPKLFNRHGRTWVQYLIQQRVWLPLIVPMPVSFAPNLSWWPHLNIGGVQMALTLMPIFLGIGMRHREPEATGILRRDTWVLGIVGVLTLALGIMGQTLHLHPGMILLMVAEISVFGWLMCMLARFQRPVLSAAVGGVRIVAILPDTPAAKMHLRRGDTILQCNGQDVPTRAALYAATQNLGTFCRLRVRGFDGQIRLAETAIFQGAPHMLGIITFPEED